MFCILIDAGFYFWLLLYEKSLVLVEKFCLHLTINVCIQFFAVPLSQRLRSSLRYKRKINIEMLSMLG